MSHHILVVDDDEHIRAVVAAILDDEGFAVATAGNGQEALAAIAASRPVLVLLDLHMPVMSGWEVLSHLRTAHVEVPVIFMTAGSQARSEARRHGADGYVTKPFEFQELITVVERFATTSGPSAYGR